VRMNRHAWLAHFLPAMTADRVDQRRLHVIAVFGHQRSVRNVGRTAGNDGGSQTCLKMTSVARVVLFEGDTFMRFAGMRLRSSIRMNRGSSPSSSSRSDA
jgi:hypothetical protein